MRKNCIRCLRLDYTFHIWPFSRGVIMVVMAALQINGLRFSKSILSRQARYPVMMASFENTMVKPLDVSFRCPAAVEP